jgi:hypothetical protein
MSETLMSQSRLSSAPNGAADGRAMARVESWMAMIRDLSREQQGEPKSASARLDELLATVTE